eukprot:264316-Amphidinium_carterae.2
MGRAASGQKWLGPHVKRGKAARTRLSTASGKACGGSGQLREHGRRQGACSQQRLVGMWHRPFALSNAQLKSSV